MTEGRKVAAILVADIVGYSRLTGVDEEGTLARLRTLRSDLINPTIAGHNGRVVKRTGDGAIVEFRSVVEAVRCAIEVRSGLAARNAGVPDDKRIEVRVGIHLGDVMEEADGDLMGDGVNVAARLESICEPGGICLSEDAYHQVRDKLNETFVDLGEQNLKNIVRPVRTYAWTPATGGRPAIPSANVVPKPSDRTQRRAGLATAVVAILENVARLIGVIAERATTPARPAIPTAGEVASAAPSAAAESRERRLRDRRLRRALIVAALIVLAAVRAWRGQESSAPPPALPPLAHSQPNNAFAHLHLTKALVWTGVGQFDASLVELNAAIESDRNLAPAYAEKGHVMVLLGRPEEAFELVEQALRLDPLDPGRNIWEWYMCNAYAHLAQWENAIDWCQKSAASNPSLHWPYFELAAANAWLGRVPEATAAVTELRKLRPGFTVHDYLILPKSENAKWRREDERITEGLRKAGLPES